MTARYNVDIKTKHFFRSYLFSISLLYQIFKSNKHKEIKGLKGYLNFH